MISFFDFINLIFDSSKGREWNELTSYEKNAHQFMLNRTMAKGFPYNSMQLNLVKTDGLGVAETWRIVARRFYGNGVPRFVYAKSNIQPKEKSRVADIPKECIDFWCEKYECGMREFNELLEINPDGLIDELKYIKNFIEKPKPNKNDKSDQ